MLRNEDYQQQCVTRNEIYGQIYADWGDIHAYAQNFKGWFDDRGRDLFAEPYAELMTEQLTPGEDQLEDDARVIYLQVPIFKQQYLLTREFERVIQREQRRLRVNRSKEPSKSKYPVHANPNVSALERYLRVWDMKKEGFTAPEIHEEVFGSISEAQIRANYDKRNEGMLKHEANRLRQQRYYSVVARAHKAAETMISNTALGIFPCKDMQ